MPWRTHSAFPRPTATLFAGSSPITADALRLVREPLRWQLAFGGRAPAGEVLTVLRRAVLGPCDGAWSAPTWLLPHQVPAARRLAATLEVFRGALLADSVGLGKTYVALAVAHRFGSAAVLAPATLVPQWRRVMCAVGVELPLLSHEALSRGAAAPQPELLVVDEAHRFRNAGTHRYDRLAAAAPRARLLLLTATPVVNCGADLVNLLRLFLPDQALALFGVPSLAASAASRAFESLAHAASALIVARSPRAIEAPGLALPAVGDGEVITQPPLDPGALGPLLEAIDGLEFPTFADSRAAELLRLHLSHRLASSVPAFAESLRRHRAYLERAMAAAERGEPLTRAAARHLVGNDDDLQLQLEGLLPSSSPALDASSLERERCRISRLITRLEEVPATDPKADAFERLLGARGGARTLVFTTAIATAGHLARRVGWRRVAVATARGARIASGSIQLDEALSCFAPRARGQPDPPRALNLATLIATDLASEGLDLQDADGVVHYDLPWTPLRLEQRIGRIARLGSPHAAVRVWWFRPAPELEARLALAHRLRDKLLSQVRLGVATSSDLGHARVLGGLFDWRERFATVSEPAEGGPRFAVVRAPRMALIGLRWTIGPHCFRELTGLAGEPPAAVQDERQLAHIVRVLEGAPWSNAPPGEAWAAALRRAVRRRLAEAWRGPGDDDTRRLARRVLRLAAVAGRSRNRALLTLLDAALDRLTTGLPVGPARALERALAARAVRPHLSRWLESFERVPDAYPMVALEAALLGDGQGGGAA